MNVRVKIIQAASEAASHVSLTYKLFRRRSTKKVLTEKFHFSSFVGWGVGVLVLSL